MAFSMTRPHVELGKIVKARRTQLKLTLRGAAELAGVDHTLWLRLEKGHDIRLSEWVKIARKFNIDLPKEKSPP